PAFASPAPLLHNTPPVVFVTVAGGEPHEPARIPVERAVRGVRHPGARRTPGPVAGGSRGGGTVPRGIPLGGQGPGARGRPRQGGRRAARAIARRRAPPRAGTA